MHFCHRARAKNILLEAVLLTGNVGSAGDHIGGAQVVSTAREVGSVGENVGHLVVVSDGNVVLSLLRVDGRRLNHLHVSGGDSKESQSEGQERNGLHYCGWFFVRKSECV
jgi:hypothetical protein